MAFIAVFIITILLFAMLVIIGGLESKGGKCPYKGACSSTTCPYWNKCELKNTFKRY
jgi:hypothetical protein